jgi:hypothetical protein
MKAYLSFLLFRFFDLFSTNGGRLVIWLELGYFESSVTFLHYFYIA